MLSNSSLTPKNLYVYCFAHLITAGPGTVYFLSIIIHNQAPSGLLLFVNFTLGLTGFVNSLIYFFQRKASERKAVMTATSFRDSYVSESIEKTLAKELNAPNFGN